MNPNSPDEPENQNPEPPTTSSPPLSEDPAPSLDEDLKEQDQQNKPSEPTGPKPVVLGQKIKGDKKKWLILGIVILIIVLGVLYFVFVRQTKSTPTQQSTTNQTQPAAQAQTYTPDNVAYAFKSGSTSPYTIYWRPASGGTRTISKQLVSKDAFGGYDVSGSNVVFYTAKNIFVSTDSGKSYKSVVTIDNSNPQTTITSIKFSNDGKNIAYALLNGISGKNTVKSIDLTGASAKDLFIAKAAGVFIEGYSAAKQKIIYREGCYFCDGTPALPVIRDLKSSKISQLISGIADNEFIDLSVSTDFSTIVFVHGTANPDAPEQGPPGFIAAPYVFQSIDIASAKTTTLGSVGTKGEKSANGTLRTRIVLVGFLAGTTTPYYSVDNQLFTYKSGRATLTYDAGKKLQYVVFVSGKNVIAGSGDDVSDFTLANFNIATQKSTTIFQGDENTIIFGITTK